MSGVNRKHDRNRKWCEAYRARGQREINKARKLWKHVKKHGRDLCAMDALERLPALAKKRAE